MAPVHLITDPLHIYHHLSQRLPLTASTSALLGYAQAIFKVLISKVTYLYYKQNSITWKTTALKDFLAYAYTVIAYALNSRAILFLTYTNTYI